MPPGGLTGSRWKTKNVTVAEHPSICPHTVDVAQNVEEAVSFLTL